MGSVDADAHVVESIRTWTYLDESDARYRPLVTTQTWGPEVRTRENRAAVEYWVIDNRYHAKDLNIGSDTSDESRELTDVGARLAHMDELDIDIQVIYPSLFLRPVVRTAAAELALTRAYNRWLAEVNSHARDRLRWVALPALLSPGTIHDEMARARDRGACGIFMRGLEWDRHLTDPYFFPVYETAAELDMAICIHSGNNSALMHDFALEDSSYTRFIQPGIQAFHSLLEKDIPGKFPEVRWGFVELGSQWLSYMVKDLELRFPRLGRQMPESLLAANRMYVACATNDDIPYLAGQLGEDNLMLGTDYGHADLISRVDAFEVLRNRTDLSPPLVEKITEINPRALYGL